MMGERKSKFVDGFQSWLISALIERKEFFVSKKKDFKKEIFSCLREGKFVDVDVNVC